MSDKFDTRLFVRGSSHGLREYRDERGQVVGHAVQMLKRNPKNGGVEVLSVRLPEGADPTRFAEGKSVELPVNVSHYEGQLFYRGLPDAPAPADARAADRLQAAAPRV